MNGILIGRFQPFHNGHLNACREILRECSKLIIAISNPEDSEETIFEDEPDEKIRKIITGLRLKEKNPFTFKERKAMIQKSLLENSIKNFEIVPFYGIYTHGVEMFESVMPEKKNSIIFIPFKENSQKEFQELFEKHGWKTKILKIKENISASKIREMIKNHQDVTKLVPKAVYELMK